MRIYLYLIKQDLHGLRTEILGSLGSSRDMNLFLRNGHKGQLEFLSNKINKHETNGWSFAGAVHLLRGKRKNPFFYTKVLKRKFFFCTL